MTNENYNDKEVEVFGDSIHKDHNNVETTHNTHILVDGEREDLVLGHSYSIEAGEFLLPVEFQCGPVKEVGINGATNEALLSILIHRTKILDANFPSEDNKHAIKHMEYALEHFNNRTKDRQNRGVEGKNEV